MSPSPTQSRVGKVLLAPQARSADVHRHPDVYPDPSCSPKCWQSRQLSCSAWKTLFAAYGISGTSNIA